MITTFKIKDCNYVVLSAKQKIQFQKEYEKLFQYGVSFDFIIVSDSSKEPYRNIYIELHENDKDKILAFQLVLTEFCLAVRSNITEISNPNISEEAVKNLFPDTSYKALVYDKWDKELDDSFLQKVTDIANAVTRISFCAVNDKLYRTKLEIISSNAERIRKYIFDTFDIKPKSDKKINFSFRSELTGICMPAVYSKLIPFCSAESCDTSNSAFDYGNNRITKNPLRYDRRNSRLPNGFVVGTSGSGKSCFIKNEIKQVLDKTEDDVIIIDPSNEFLRTNEQRCKRIELSNGGCINPLDIVIDSLDENGDYALKETADLVVGLIEMLLSLKEDIELDKYEVTAIHNAVRSVLFPFIYELVKNKDEYALAYDFENNPTFGEVVDYILKMNGNEHILELQKRLQAVKPYLKDFYGRTNIPENRRIIFGFDKVPCKLEPFYYAVTLSYINRRIFMKQGNSERLWVYFDEAHQLFQNKYVADTTLTIHTRSRINGTICTFVTHDFSDLMNKEQGQAIVSNSGFMIFLNQSSIDRELMQKLLGISDKMLEFVHNCPAGDGIFCNDVGAKIPFYRLIKYEEG